MRGSARLLVTLLALGHVLALNTRRLHMLRLIDAGVVVACGRCMLVKRSGLSEVADDLDAWMDEEGRYNVVGALAADLWRGDRDIDIAPDHQTKCSTAEPAREQQGTEYRDRV